MGKREGNSHQYLYLLLYFLLRLSKNNFKATEQVNSRKLENKLVDFLKASQKIGRYMDIGHTIATSGHWTWGKETRSTLQHPPNIELRHYQAQITEIWIQDTFIMTKYDKILTFPKLLSKS